MKTDQSKFSMWRACVAIMQLDGFINSAERTWIHNKLKMLPLSNEQKTILLSDIEKKVHLESVIGDITDKNDRAFLLHLFRVVSHLDGHFTAEEKAAYSRLEKVVLSSLNLPEIEKQAEKIEADSYERTELDNPHSLFEAAFRTITNFLK